MQGTLQLSRRNGSSGTGSPRGSHSATLPLGSWARSSSLPKTSEAPICVINGPLIFWPFSWHDADSGLDKEGQLGLYTAPKPCMVDTPASRLPFWSVLGWSFLQPSSLEETWWGAGTEPNILGKSFSLEIRSDPNHPSVALSAPQEGQAQSSVT